MKHPRIGHGFDLHRLEAGRKLILGGHELAHDRGCAGHSDGDAVYHAVTDAVLGALCEQDIGELFPDDDPAHAGADSARFLDEAVLRMRGEGLEVGNLDVTVILERPKLAPHKATLRANLAERLGCASSRVNLKAKTHEGVDALGENRAVACHAVVLLVPDAEA